MKDRQIKLLEGRKIPLVDEIKGKKYCKWHHSWTHTLNNCTIFKNAIQKVLKEGRLKQAEKGGMTVDSNPFGLSMNMVSVSITRKEQKEGKVLRWEKELKEKKETGSSQKAIWRSKFVKLQDTKGQDANQSVSVFQRLQYPG